MIIMGKKAVIVVSMVEESVEKSNEEIKKEILEELSRHPPTIPWLKKVEKVTVTEAESHYKAGPQTGHLQRTTKPKKTPRRDVTNKM